MSEKYRFHRLHSIERSVEEYSDSSTGWRWDISGTLADGRFVVLDLDDVDLEEIVRRYNREATGP